MYVKEDIYIYIYVHLFYSGLPKKKSFRWNLACRMLFKESPWHPHLWEVGEWSMMGYKKRIYCRSKASFNHPYKELWGNSSPSELSRRGLRRTGLYAPTIINCRIYAVPGSGCGEWLWIRTKTGSLILKKITAEGCWLAGGRAHQSFPNNRTSFFCICILLSSSSFSFLLFLFHLLFYFEFVLLYKIKALYKTIQLPSMIKYLMCAKFEKKIGFFAANGGGHFDRWVSDSVPTYWEKYGWKQVAVFILALNAQAIQRGSLFPSGGFVCLNQGWQTQYTHLGKRQLGWK